jgi:hypothetical protein
MITRNTTLPLSGLHLSHFHLFQVNRLRVGSVLYERFNGVGEPENDSGKGKRKIA